MSEPAPGSTPPLRIRYHLEFEDGATQDHVLELDPDTLLLRTRPEPPHPEWTELAFNKCANCPLEESEHSRCPAALSLVGIIDRLPRTISHTPVTVTIDTEARQYRKKTTLQQALSSLMGLAMAASGCPVLGKMRPMARQHLPFAKLAENESRMVSMYLLAQYLIGRRGGIPDWSLKGLSALFREIHTVNEHFSRRLSRAARGDASLNALVTLDCFTETVGFVINEQVLQSLERLFAPYLEDQSSAPEDHGA